MKASYLPLPTCIFFDMDGTLLQTEQRAEQTWLDVFTSFAPRYAATPELLSQTMNNVYTDYKQTIAGNETLLLRDRLHPFDVRKSLAEHVLQSVGEPDADLAEQMVHLYDTFREQHRRTTPFALETLDTLRKQRFHLALLTNGNASYQRRKIEQQHLAAFFECILIEEEFGVGKSDPRIYQAALDHLQVHAHETWMIGDNLCFDVATPQQLGIMTFWFDPTNKGLPPHPPAQPDRILHTFPDILRELHRSRFPPSSSYIASLRFQE